METSISNTPSVSLRSGSDNHQENSRSNSKELINGSVDSSNVVLGEPRIRKRRDRSPSESSDGRAIKSRGNPYSNFDCGSLADA